MLRCEGYLGGETLGRRHVHRTRYETDLARDEDAFVYLDKNRIEKGKNRNRASATRLLLIYAIETRWGSLGLTTMA